MNDRASSTHLRTPLRIAVVTETYPPEINGVAMTIAKMVGGLTDRGHTIQLIRPSRGKGDRAERSALSEEVLVPGMAIPGYDFLTLTDHVVLPDMSVPGYPYSESGEFMSNSPAEKASKRVARLSMTRNVISSR